MRRSAALGALFVLIACLVWPGAAAAGPAAAQNLTPACTVAVSSNEKKASNLTDGEHSTAWTAAKASGQFVEVDLPSAAAGVYIMWNCVPQEWTLLESAGDSLWNWTDITGKDQYINTYIPLKPDTVKFRIESESFDWRLSIAEIRVYGAGLLPDDVQVWQPSPAKADLMVIPAHPDDEFIYLGGVLPYYAGQLGKHTAVVYMTSSPMIRKFEALNGLWKAGVREYPVFLPLANKYSSTLDDAEKYWDGLDNAVDLLVEQIRRFRPDVVVTHDLNGEYGHGAHMLTALATEKAVVNASDAEQSEASAGEYGAWTVKKCYLHLFDEHTVEMNWNEPLSRFHGATALDMAKECYALHVSQHFRDRPIEDKGPYDNAKFGLYYTTVGPDRMGDDLFENIKEPTPTASHTAIPEPTASPSATPTAEPESTAASAPAEKSDGFGAAMLLVLPAALIAGALYALIREWKNKDEKNE